MITRLKVDGFRSLSRFDMAINPGLNILVGPNGSGKTNIVSFLQFLSYLTTNQLSEAIAKAGGAGAVFQKIGSTQYRKGLLASIEGTYNYIQQERYHPPLSPSSVTRRRPEQKAATIRYEFDFELAASPDLDVIVYSQQTLSAWKTQEADKTPPKNDEPDLKLTLRAPEGQEPTLHVDHMAVSKFDTGLRMPTSQRSDLFLDDLLKHILGRGDEFVIPRLGSFISDFRSLRTDFSPEVKSSILSPLKPDYLRTAQRHL